MPCTLARMAALIAWGLASGAALAQDVVLSLIHI